MFAIIQTGGKQYKVAEKDILEIEKLSDLNSGDLLNVDEVLLIAKSDNDVIIGRPYIEGACVELKVIDHVQGDKIKGFTYKAKKRVQRHFGHRQKYTEVEVVKILESGKKTMIKIEKKEEISEKKLEEKMETKEKTVKKAVSKKTTSKPKAKKAE